MACRKQIVCLIACVTVLLLVCDQPVLRGGVDPAQSKRAREALEKRMKERFAAGWKPKSKQQQLVTRLRMSEIGWRRRQHRAAQRSIFEAAKAEAYMQLAMQYTSIVDVYRVPTMTLVEDPNSGLVRPVMARAEYHVVDPFAAALAAHWGEKAARSKAFAVAQDYRAKTYYRERIETVQNRIEALQGYALARQIRNPAGRLP